MVDHVIPARTEVLSLQLRSRWVKMCQNHREVYGVGLFELREVAATEQRIWQAIDLEQDCLGSYPLNRLMAIAANGKPVVTGYRPTFAAGAACLAEAD